MAHTHQKHAPMLCVNATRSLMCAQVCSLDDLVPMDCVASTLLLHGTHLVMGEGAESADIDMSATARRAKLISWC